MDIFAPFLGRVAVFLHQAWELGELKLTLGLEIFQIILPGPSFWWSHALSRKGKPNKSWVRGNSWWDRLNASRAAGGLSFLYSPWGLHGSPHLLSWPRCLVLWEPGWWLGSPHPQPRVARSQLNGKGVAATDTHQPVSEFMENGQQTWLTPPGLVGSNPNALHRVNHRNRACFLRRPPHKLLIII